MSEIVAKKRYSPKEEASKDEQITHIAECVEFIFGKLYNVYDNDKIKSKINTVTTKKTYEKNDEFLYEKTIPSNTAKLFLKNESNAFGSLLWKRTRKSLAKLFNLVVEYYSSFPFIEDFPEYYETLVNLQFGPDPLKNEPKAYMFNINWNISEVDNYKSLEFLEFLTDLLVKTFYKVDSEIYEYNKTLNLSCKDLYFLQMLLMCLTAKDSFLLGSVDKTLFVKFDEIQKQVVVKPSENENKTLEKRETQNVNNDKPSVVETCEKKTCKRLVDDDQVLPTPKRKPNILKKKPELKVVEDLKLVDEMVKPTIAKPIKKRIIKK